VRTTKRELAAALMSADFADQVIFFGCHGQAPGGSEDHRGGPALKLSDDELIQASDFHDWLREHALRANPIIFICACHGGRLQDGALRLDSYGRELLLKGANCLIGPQIQLPIDFSREYVRAFFDLKIFNCGGYNLCDLVSSADESQLWPACQPCTVFLCPGIVRAEEQPPGADC
jgi:hypothetical protein